MTFLLSLLGVGGIAGGAALYFIGPAVVLGFLKAVPWQIWAIIGGIVAALLLWHLHTGIEKRAHDAAFNEGWNAYDTKLKAAQKVAVARNLAATTKADQERQTDTTIIATKQEERTNAISQSTPSSTGAASHALGCVRYRQQHPGSAVPAACAK